MANDFYKLNSLTYDVLVDVIASAEEIDMPTLTREYIDECRDELSDPKRDLHSVQSLAAFGAFLSLLQTAQIANIIRLMRKGEVDAADKALELLESSLDLNERVHVLSFDLSKEALGG